ncbi:GGDEF domain-containing protein [Rubrivivax rivuli]|uniref:diguanylate cyclase n=1 Tax=Rubrivivax rivuli TaxID=1862385 RepID=A0A437RR63_9BURK|nr:tetratricopeptide repeat-containing diguanylate cyclase [Rubrivivax rivuli]RVU49269.1 diguanylate cyclase [Rubrivivax rivuli]
MGRFGSLAVRACAAGLVGLLWLGAAAASPRLAEIERTLRAQPEAMLEALKPVLADARGDERALALLLQARQQYAQQDLAGLDATAQALEALAPQSGLAPAAALLARGLAVSRTPPLGRADRSFNAAAAALPAATPPQVRWYFTNEQARMRQALGRLDESVAFSQQAVEQADAGGVAWQRSEARSALAYSLYLAQQTDRAMPINIEADRIAVAAGDINARIHSATTAAILYTALGNDDEELKASKLAVDLARQAGARGLEALAMANLADFYVKRGDYRTALALAEQALPLAREVGQPSSEAVALINAGLAQIGLGRHEKGIALIRQALVIDERTSGLPALADTHGELGAALEKHGHLKEAWAAWVEHRRLADRVFQREHQQAVLELQEGLDADRRQRELAALETENGLKAEQLLARELQQRLWALGLVAGLLLLGVLALLLRRMRQANLRLRHSNEALKVATERDPLTGLANRRHFHAVMQHSAAARFEGTLLLLDLDHFKRINDRHGHAAGDAVLVDIAQRLQGVLREEDLTVRWGGEEFLVLVRQLPPEQVEALAERLLATVGSRPVFHGQEAVAVTASIGFASFPLPPAREPVSWERALDVVDTALYLAKAHGRNRAYGVRSMQTQQPESRANPGLALEAAWRQGRAELAHLKGPGAAPAAEAALP